MGNKNGKKSQIKIFVPTEIEILCGTAFIQRFNNRSEGNIFKCWFRIDQMSIKLFILASYWIQKSWWYNLKFYKFEQVEECKIVNIPICWELSYRLSINYLVCSEWKFLLEKYSKKIYFIWKKSSINTYTEKQIKFSFNRQMRIAIIDSGMILTIKDIIVRYQVFL